MRKWSLFKRRILDKGMREAELCMATLKYREARDAYYLQSSECDRTRSAHDEALRTLEARRKVWASAKLELDAIIAQPSSVAVQQ